MHFITLDIFRASSLFSISLISINFSLADVKYSYLCVALIARARAVELGGFNHVLHFSINVAGISVLRWLPLALAGKKSIYDYPEYFKPSCDKTVNLL